jgi:ribulose-5-phosphate 4-epimerase/fuculose-1-phosphate aldolase
MAIDSLPDAPRLTGPVDEQVHEQERQRRKHRLTASYRLFARFGLDEGAAGHITVRDPELTDHFWVAPFGRYFGAITEHDLLLVDSEGVIVEGTGAVNTAAFYIHSAVHEARPDVNGVAHAHGLHGKTFAALPRLLAPLTQDSCAFYQRHVRFDEFSGVVLDREYGQRIAAALGDNRALILANHGHLTAAPSLEAAVWWFISMERCFQSELIARAADTPAEIDPEDAALTASQHTVEYAETCFEALYERITAEQPDLLKPRAS